MTANSLYLVCQHCATQDNALLIASRSSGEAQYVASLSSAKADKWFARHLKCGTAPDKYALAHERPPNWDVSPPADPVSAAIRTELALSSLNGSDTEH